MSKLQLNKQIVKDKENKPIAVVLDIDSYRNLLNYIEDLEDAIAIDKIKANDDGTRIPLEELIDELKTEGLIDQ